ncbi:DoxX family protein [Flavobacterium sp. H122]|uniref:DoxX family protein n=1 Tax=Flavobacterium sp. H122 TaxID=2529860 RepID=UPI0010A9A659|nr:DoxX family protein [Flavobacterium sp. H122]
MEKKKNIGYWVITSILCFCMLGGIGQLFQVKEVVAGFEPLGYPTYFISVIGFWKVMAIIAILLPKLPLIKEWAYAGIFFAMTGASISHIAVNDSLFHIIVPMVIAGLAIFSWYLRPADRKLAFIKS